MKGSLQKIEDKYVQEGLRGKKLAKALLKDRKYKNILKVRRENVKNRFKLTQKDKNKYILSTNLDYEILGIIYKLEKSKLSSRDREMAQLIRTQLEADWRSPLLKTLNRLLKKYDKGIAGNH